MNFTRELILENKILTNEDSFYGKRFDNHIETFFENKHIPITRLSFGLFNKKGKSYTFKSKTKVNPEIAQDINAMGIDTELELANLVSENFVSEVILASFNKFRSEKLRFNNELILENTNKVTDVVSFIKKIKRLNKRYTLFVSMEIAQIIEEKIDTQFVESKTSYDTPDSLHLFSYICSIGKIEIIAFPYFLNDECCLVKNFNEIEFFFENSKTKEFDIAFFSVSNIYYINYNIPNSVEFKHLKLKDIERNY
jgi:hypothetical protein